MAPGVTYPGSLIITHVKKDAPTISIPQATVVKLMIREMMIIAELPSLLRLRPLMIRRDSRISLATVGTGNRLAGRR